MLSLIIPTYSERENIEAVIRRVCATLTSTQEEFEVIVVDDDSWATGLLSTDVPISFSIG